MDREPIWFKNFRINQEAFNEKVDERLTNIENRLDSLEYKVDAILECPTIKNEIKL